MKRLILAVLLLSLPAFGAAVTAGISTASTSNASSYASGSFTPALNDLLVVFVSASDTIAPNATMTDSQSLGFRLVGYVPVRTSADTLYLFIAKALAANSSMTVTFDCTGDAATGAVIQVARVSGMTRTGYNAVRQFGFQANHASGAPAPAFPGNALTGNPTLGAIMNATNPATMTTPTNWTEQDDTGYATPTTGAEYVSRDSGFTSTTVTWGSSSASAYGALIVELDTSAASGLLIDDISVATSISAGTSVTWTHVCTGTNLALFVLPDIVDNQATPWALITGITYNGVALKKIAYTRDFGGSELFTYAWVLPAPATGSHSIVISLSENINVGTGFIGASAISFTGAHQTYPYRLPMTKGTGLTGVTSFGITANETQAGDYIIGSAISHNATITQDSGQMPITLQNGFGIATNQAFSSSVMPVVSNTSLTWGQSPSQVLSGVAITVRPATDVPATPVLDNINSGPSVGSSVSSVSISSVLVSTGANLLFYTAFYNDGPSGNTVSTVTYGGVSLTKLDSQSIVFGGNHCHTEIWYLKSPAAGSATVVATFSGTISEYVSGATAFYLVNQASPFGTVAKNSGTGATFTATVTSSTGALVADALYVDGSLEPNLVPTGDNGWHAVNAVNNSTGATQFKPGAASVSMSYHDDNNGSTIYNIMGVGINFGASSISSGQFPRVQ